MSDIAVVVFPGSNCDRDAFHAFSNLLGRSVSYHWHDQPLKKSYKLVVLPGGFSYGDYLRAGAIARFSAAVESVYDYVESGGNVLGICNGFQILVEAKLLPGMLLKNRSLRFQCESVYVRSEKNRSALLQDLEPGKVMQMPIAHSQGRFVATTPEEMAALEKNGQIILRYCDASGGVTDAANANGSDAGVAGVTNERGNVLGLMPHPERASEAILGSADGLSFLKAIERRL